MNGFPLRVSIAGFLVISLGRPRRRIGLHVQQQTIKELKRTNATA